MVAVAAFSVGADVAGAPSVAAALSYHHAPAARLAPVLTAVTGVRLRNPRQHAVVTSEGVAYDIVNDPFDGGHLCIVTLTGRPEFRIASERQGLNNGKVFAYPFVLRGPGCDGCECHTGGETW